MTEDDNKLAQSSLDLAPANIREWLQHFRAVMEKMEAQGQGVADNIERLNEIVSKLAITDHTEAAACPFNQGNPNYEDARQFINRIGSVEEAVGKLSSVVVTLAEVQLKIARVEGAFGLVKWIGLPALAALFGLAIKAAFFN